MRDLDGAYVMKAKVNPWFEQQALHALEPEPYPAAEQMEGELAVGEPNKNRGAHWLGSGPSLAQILEDLDGD